MTPQGDGSTGGTTTTMETTFDRQISLERGIGVIEVEKEKEKEKEAGKGSYRDKAPPHILSQNGSRSGVVGATSGIFAMEKEVGSTRSPRGQATPRVLTPNGKNYLGGPGATSGTGDQRKGDFSMFRTKSTLGMVSRQNSFLLMRRDTEQDHQQQADGISAAAGTDDMVHGSVPAGRYFAALRGPELDQVRDYEDILLPKDEVWPFLLRFPIGCFGVSLGIGSLANLWGALALSPAMAFLQINLDIHFALWLLTLAVFISVAITYTLKCIFYFEAIRREYYHPVRVNFFFAPWVGCMFLAMGAPRRLAPERLHPAVWCCLITPVIILELKMYGQWLSGGKHRLSKVANPSSHLAVVGNFIGAMLAAKVGWLEAGKFLWAVGLAHYLCVFVTLYQRLPSSEALPKELHPVYSMFIATPMAASISWSLIHGRFDEVSRIFYFTALFLYCTLLVRINFFRGFKFSLAWWSYTFPLTTASMATIKYAEEVPCVLSKGLAVVLSLLSSTIVLVMLVSTLLHALVWQSLFPNDLAIAITKDRKALGSRQRSRRERKSPRKSENPKHWTRPSLSLSPVPPNKNNSLGEKDLEAQ